MTLRTTSPAPPPPLWQRIGAGGKSLRVKLLLLGLAVALLPLALLAVAWIYEQAVIAGEIDRLRAAATAARGARPDELTELGTRLRVEIARLDGAGRLVARSRTMAAALDRSTIGKIGERLVGGDPPEPLVAADAELGP